MKNNNQNELSHKKNPVIWTLTDNRPGNNSQVLGVGQHINYPTTRVEVTYNNFFFLRLFLSNSSSIGFSRDTFSSAKPPWPDLVISAGRRAAHFASWVKTQSLVSTKLVSIMFPGRNIYNNFDLIAIPKHDNIDKVKEISKIVRISGAPSNISDSLLEQKKSQFSKVFNDFPRPLIAILAGGDTKKYKYSLRDCFDFSKDLTRLSKTTNGTFLLATSRRTSKMMQRVLQKGIPNLNHTSIWDQEKINYYHAYLALADEIIVTGDSISMCSEALSTKKPVYIYLPSSLKNTKYSRYSEEMFRNGYAKPFQGKLESWESNYISSEIALAGRINKFFL